MKKTLKKPVGYPKRNPAVNASTTGGPGPRNVDQTNWRHRMREGRIKFDDDAKLIFLRAFAEHGRMTEAAFAANVTGACVNNHLKIDPDFLAAFQEAKAIYRDKFIKHAQNLMFDGVDEPILGGRFKDEVVAHKRVYPLNLIAMEMRRVEPEYKERTEVDMTVNGGVLVVPPRISPSEWAEKYGKPAPTGEADQQKDSG